MTGRVEVVPGPGVVVRHGHICVWVAPEASHALLQFLAQSAHNLAASARGGRLLADHVAGVLERGDPEPGVAFVTVGPDSTGTWTALLHGPVRVWDGGRWAEAPIDPGWECITVPAAPVVLAGAATTQPVPGGSHPLLDLEGGAVPGGGFALIDLGAPELESPAHEAGGREGAPTTVVPSVPAPSLPAPSVPGRDAPTSVLPTTSAGEARHAAPDPSGDVPAVRGVRCRRGHLNHPESAACATCGEDLDPAGAVVTATRPPLGVLVVDDGSIYALARPYLLGSAAAGDPAVAAGRMLALTLGGAQVAGVHAEIRVSDWTVAVADRAAAGSTHLLARDGDGWRALTPGAPQVLPPGGHLAVGSRVLTFVSPWPG